MSFTEDIKIAFPSLDQNNCHKIINDDYFELLDCKDKECELVCENKSEYNFKVYNDKKIDINFVPIDKCIFTDGDGKKCDCLLYTDNELSFIEIKNPSNTDHGSKQRKNLKRIAVEQLENTIKEFKNIINLDSYSFKNIEAILSLSWKPSRPLISCNKTNKRVEFYETYGVDLIEGNEKRY